MKFLYLVILLPIFGCYANQEAIKKPTSPNTVDEAAEFLPASTNPNIGSLELVAELDINPGNVAVSGNGRIFSSVHQFRPQPIKVIEITGTSSYEAFPSDEWNQRFVAVLGIYADRKNRLWVLDNGNVSEPSTPMLYAFDINNKGLVYEYEFPESVGAKGTFLQDLAVDDNNDWVYIADVGGNAQPAIVAVDVKNSISRRFTASDSLTAKAFDMVVEDTLIADSEGNPVRIGINPITISDDHAFIYFGAMSGTIWYSLPTEVFRKNMNDSAIAASIEAVGAKPVSDGAASDAEGNHYFTDVNNNAISMLTPTGLHTLVQDKRLIWPDNVRFGGDSWLYIAVNQLNRAAPFNSGVDAAQKPFKIMRVWTGKKGSF